LGYCTWLIDLSDVVLGTDISVCLELEFEICCFLSANLCTGAACLNRDDWLGFVL